MGRLRAATLFLAVLAVGCLLAACGSDDKGELLPGTTADQIESNLDLVRESHAAGDCEGAETAVAEVSEEIDALQKVDSKLKSALEQGATKLSEKVSDCGANAEAEEQKEQEADQADEEQEQVEVEEAQAEEEEALEKAQKVEERDEKAREREGAEERAEQPGPEEGKESGPEEEGKTPEGQEEIEPPSEEVTPPVEEGGAGGIGPGAAVEGGP